MKLTLGFSPCPNDTYIFDALVHAKVDTEGLEFEYLLADVEELNRKAFHEELDITKVSFHAFLFLARNYVLLNSGSALGFGAGPLIIAKKLFSLDDLSTKSIAIPGKFTTANLLFSLAVPGNPVKKEMLFSDIEQAVLNETVDAGLIIHENRFTYEAKGLFKIADLGDYWEKLSGKPIPLGGIIARRSFPDEILQKVNRVLHRSVQFAMESNNLSDFVRCNAQEMSTEVMQKHIQLYVNEFTLNLGEAGRTAVNLLINTAIEKGIIDEFQHDPFLSADIPPI